MEDEMTIFLVKKGNIGCMFFPFISAEILFIEFRLEICQSRDSC